MNRDELLTKMAMELAEWPTHKDFMVRNGNEFCPTVYLDGNPFKKHEYLQRRAELINKPSWDEAPEWAQWLAQDEDGEWWWYENEPEPNDEEGCFDAKGRLESICAGIDDIAGHNWRDTLEARPEWPEDRIDTIGSNGNDGHHYGTSSLHYDEDDRSVCTDGSPCGKPANPDDDAYCLNCPSYVEAGDKTERTIEDVVADWQAAHPEVMSRSKYHREVKPGVWIDVYDVLNAWGVKNPALQHLIKKALAPGKRGHKDLMTDMDDIVASAKRAKELES